MSEVHGSLRWRVVGEGFLEEVGLELATGQQARETKCKGSSHAGVGLGRGTSARNFGAGAVWEGESNSRHRQGPSRRPCALPWAAGQGRLTLGRCGMARVRRSHP